MQLEIIGSEFCEFQLDKIVKHHEKEASLNVTLELIEGILNEPEILHRSPSIGQKEPLLGKECT